MSLGDRDGTIEAVGREYGVRTMSASRRSWDWTHAGHVPGLNYDVAALAPMRKWIPGGPGPRAD